MDIGHLSHPVYGAPELATALVDNPAEYLPIVRALGCWANGDVPLLAVCTHTVCTHAVLSQLPTFDRSACAGRAVPLPPAPAVPQFEQAAKQESQRIQSLNEDGGDPDVKDVQARCVRSLEGLVGLAVWAGGGSRTAPGAAACMPLRR